MSTHVFGLTVSTLADAQRAASAIDHQVTLVDDTCHMVVVVDKAGHVVIRPVERENPAWLYRTAGS